MPWCRSFLRPFPRPSPRPSIRPSIRPSLPAVLRKTGPRIGAMLRNGWLALWLAGLATTASAQIIPTGAPAADILLTRAIGEQRLFLTCSALDPRDHRSILDSWQRDVDSAAALLRARGVPAEAVAAFQAAAEATALLPAADTPWAEIRELCEADPDWQDRWTNGAYTLLARDLPKVFP